jgi:hypothetical protein
MMTDIDATNEDDRVDYVRRLVAARIPELSETDPAQLGDAESDPDDRLPASIAEQILQIVEMLVDRMDALEAAVSPG